MYWGLRDYGTAQWEGGDEGCDHKGRSQTSDASTLSEWKNGGGQRYKEETGGMPFAHECGKCGAKRIDSQLGLEKTPEEYVAKMVEVFREVRRVLRKDGTLWLNLGDSYAGSWGNSGRRPELDEDAGGQRDKNCEYLPRGGWDERRERPASSYKLPGLKPKDLVGIPWRVAFALQADGWVLRSDVIWNKPNPMPESVTDRPTKSHEYLFLFSKARWCGEDRRRFADISDDEARWLALFLDTEGNICCKRVKAEGRGDHFGAQICFSSCNRELVDTAQRIIGAGAILTRKGKNAPMSYLQLSNNQAADLLHRLWQFLIVKQRQASLAIYLQNVIADSGHERRTKVGRLRGRARGDEYTTELIKIWATMKQLNHFGNPDLSWMPRPKFGRWDSEPYFYDAEAIKERYSPATMPRMQRGVSDDHKNIDGAPGQTPYTMNQPRLHSKYKGQATKDYELFGAQNPSDSKRRIEESILNGTGANKRSVWTVATAPYPEAHFATYPPDLIKPCVLASSRVGDTILDPFAGSGTTGMVALELGRKAILIELNPKYIGLIRQRCDVTPGLALA